MIDTCKTLSREELEAHICSLERQIELRVRAAESAQRELEELQREVSSLRRDTLEEEQGLNAWDTCAALRADLREVETLLSDSGFASPEGVKASLLAALLYIEVYRKRALAPAVWRKSKGYA